MARPLLQVQGTGPSVCRPGCVRQQLFCISASVLWSVDRRIAPTAIAVIRVWLALIRSFQFPGLTTSILLPALFRIHKF
jgi:hypothetical protein